MIPIMIFFLASLPLKLYFLLYLANSYQCSRFATNIYQIQDYF